MRSSFRSEALFTLSGVAALALALGASGCSSDDSSSSKEREDGGSNDSGNSTGGASGDAAASPDSNGVTDASEAGDGGPRFTVTTENGDVVGKGDGKTHAFFGIPYAAPPTGELRFQPPAPAPAWSTPLDASVPGHVCPQIAPGGTTLDARSDEDCLTLNVWAPDPAPASPMPVMVWIHGGAFVFGSGSETYYSGATVADEGKVVVVTINYRLGALGFLALPELSQESSVHPTSGNYGFEDQQAALGWVKRNIAAFGGDPDKVTIWGESAGGYSVCAHLVAPGSANLFQRAISESGLCNGLIDQQRDAEYAHGQALASALGCTDSASVLTCLRSKTAADFVNAASGAPSLPGGLFFQGPRASPDGGATVSQPWSPVVDGDVIPVGIATGPSVAKVPLLLGTNANEGTLFSAPGLFGGTPVANEAEYQEAVTRTFGATTAANVLSTYPASAYASANDALNDVATDAFFACPARRLAALEATAGTSAFLYAFTHVAEMPLLPDLGSFHASELSFVFGTDAPLAPLSDAEKPLGATIRRYWARFAHTGDPNGASDPTWPKYDATGDQSLMLDLPAPAAGTGYKKTGCDFWDSVVP